MSIFLEISQLDNGDVVLREAEDGEMHARERDGIERDPILRIRFSEEVRDMLGGELVGVAEAMIDAATDFLDNLDSFADSQADSDSNAHETFVSHDGDGGSDGDHPTSPPVIH